MEYTTRGLGPNEPSLMHTRKFSDDSGRVPETVVSPLDSEDGSKKFPGHQSETCVTQKPSNPALCMQHNFSNDSGRVPETVVSPLDSEDGEIGVPDVFVPRNFLASGGNKVLSLSNTYSCLSVERESGTSTLFHHDTYVCLSVGDVVCVPDIYKRVNNFEGGYKKGSKPTFERGYRKGSRREKGKDRGSGVPGFRSGV